MFNERYFLRTRTISKLVWLSEIFLSVSISRWAVCFSTSPIRSYLRSLLDDHSQPIIATSAGVLKCVCLCVVVLLISAYSLSKYHPSSTVTPFFLLQFHPVFPSSNWLSVFLSYSFSVTSTAKLAQAICFPPFFARVHTTLIVFFYIRWYRKLQVHLFSNSVISNFVYSWIPCIPSPEVNFYC